MDRSVEVYFKSENDAESTRSSLRTVKVNNLFIDEMPEGTETRLYIPFFPTNIGAPGTAGTLAGGVPLAIRDDDSVQRRGQLTHLLHFDVNEEDYEAALSILEQHNCYNLVQ